MSGHLRYVVMCMAACLLVGVCVVPCSATAADSEGDIGALSSRYSTLNDLSSTLNSDESVIVDTRIGVLVSANQALDGFEVRFEGEAVGELVNASGGYKWLSVNSGGQAISVLLTDEQASSIVRFGDYGNTGTTLRVTGTYHVACDEHEGELDVHASDIDVLDSGDAVTHVAESSTFSAAVVLCALGAVLVCAYAVLRRRSDAKSKREGEDT